MNLSLPARIQGMIEERVRAGKYATPEDVVAAAVTSLEQQEALAEFTPGELDRLLAEGENSGPPLDGEKVLEELKGLRQRGAAGGK